MPEFILDYGTAQAAREFAQLDEFTQSYIEAAFFTETEMSDAFAGGDIGHPTFADLAPETLAAAQVDCAAFQEFNAALLERAIANAKPTRTGRIPDMAQAGRDFWYTRNGHGCGFWDGDWPDPEGDQLADAARLRGEVSLYRGDDGRIYFT